MPNGMQFPGNTGMAGNQTNQSADSSETTENAPSDSFVDFGNFSPTGEMPDFGNMGGFNDMTSNGQDAGSNTSTLVLLAVSIFFLAAGLIVAFKYKR